MQMFEFIVRRVTTGDKQAWFQMRKGVWPAVPDDYLDFDMDEILRSDSDAVFMAFTGDRPAGMVEARLREYAEACESSPVGYVEALFVHTDFRGTGVAGALLQAAEGWARDKGCTEMASDTWLENEPAIRAHLRHGYYEVDRLVHFVKQL
jgi:aminoglycoside 6'-N-acetyltransferase I